MTDCWALEPTALVLHVIVNFVVNVAYKTLSEDWLTSYDVIFPFCGTT